MVKKEKGGAESTISGTTKESSFSWLYALIVIAAAFLLYSNTIQHGFVLDDGLVCSANNFVQDGFSGIGDIFSHSFHFGNRGVEDQNYRPLMLASLAVDTGLFGNDSSSYHFMNVFLFALGCGLLYYAMSLLFATEHKWLPFLIALLFVAHPIHTEVVANIKGRDELLVFGFLMLMLIGLIRNRSGDNLRYLGLAAAAYAMAVFSKESALPLLALVPITLYFFTQQTWGKITVQSLVFVLIAGFFFFVRSRIVDPNPADLSTIDNSLISISSTSDRLATAVGMIGKYIGLLVFPHPLSYDYSFDQIPAISWTHWKAITGLLGIIGLAYFAIRAWARKSAYAYSVWYFLISFAVTNNILYLVGTTFAERLMFVPSVGFCIASAFLIQEFLNKNKQKPTRRTVTFIVLLLAVYSFKTIDRNQVWESDLSLFTSGITSAPQSTRTHSFFGSVIHDEAITTTDPAKRNQLLATAVRHYQKSLSIDPGYIENYLRVGLTFEAQGKLKAAEQAYKTGSQLDPDYFLLKLNLGVLYFKQGRFKEAILVFQSSLQLRPNHLINQRNLAMAYQGNGDLDKAIPHFKFVLKREHSIENLANLVNVLREKGDIEQAMFYDNQIKVLQGK